MKKDVIIEIKGAYRQEDDEDEIDFITAGTYSSKNGIYYIAYDESEMTGFEGCRTTLQVEDGRVVMTRSGKNKSQLIIERGVRHQCHYDTDDGISMIIGVSGSNLISHLNEDGGDLSFRYSLDINTYLTSENQVAVTVRQPAPPTC